MSLQLPLFAPDSSWAPPPVSCLPSWSSARRIGIDVETHDPQLTALGVGVRRGGKMVGVSFAIEDGPKHYLPIRHAGGDNLDERQVLGYLREQARSFSGVLVGANLDYDLDYLWEEGIETPNVSSYRDVQIADPLIYELHDRYSLDHIAKRWGLLGKNEDMLKQAAADYKVHPKKELWKLPARYVGAYAQDDAALPLQILRRQERRIDEDELWDVFNLECAVLPVLLKMRRRGVRVNLDKLAKIEAWSLAQEAEALAEVKRQCGVTIKVGDVWKPEVLNQALLAIDVKVENTKLGKPSISKDVLADIDHVVAKRLAWARKVNKLRTTFAKSVRTHQINGRIHCTFNQIAREDDEGDQQGARYGRLSCVDPNLQQQPARDEFAKQWRDIYEPDEGALWGAADYSQQEPRWTTHFSALRDFEGARKAAQAYHDDPKLDNHQFMADLTGLPRKHAKNIYLGLCYGEGGAKLCRDLGLPTRWALVVGKGRERRAEFFATREEVLEARKKEEDAFFYEAAGEEGQRILDTFDARAPFIRMLSRDVSKVAAKRGYILTAGGRRLHFPQKADGTYDWTHKALNRLIQGTSGDQVKKALAALDAAGHYLQLQVHDEIDGSISDAAEGQAMAAIMRDVMPARVPFKVDVEIGSSWGDSMG